MKSCSLPVTAESGASRRAKMAPNTAVQRSPDKPAQKSRGNTLSTSLALRVVDPRRCTCPRSGGGDAPSAELQPDVAATIESGHRLLHHFVRGLPVQRGIQSGRLVAALHTHRHDLIDDKQHHIGEDKGVDRAENDRFKLREEE